MALIYILAVLLGILSISLLIVKSCLRNKVRHFILFWSETLTNGDRDIEKMLDLTHFVSDRKVREFCEKYKNLVSDYETLKLPQQLRAEVEKYDD